MKMADEPKIDRVMAGPTIDRRGLLAAGLGMLAGAPAFSAVAGRATSQANTGEGVTAPEDLMREHGVLDRCLLTYEAGMQRLQARQEVPPEVFLHTADLVRTFIERYHEQNEEDYIFPVFERARRLVDLVQTLKGQHLAGRRVTAEIRRLAQPALFRYPDNRVRLADFCQTFIRMYRPHEARDDTVLFPALRALLPAREVLAVGDRMQEAEHRDLGSEGVELVVEQVAAIEVELGIDDLGKFTPRV